MKTYTLKEVRDMLGQYGSGIDPFDDEDLAPMYVERDVLVSTLREYDYNMPLTVDNWIENQQEVTLAGELWVDTAGVETIRTLMQRYELGLSVYPILVDKDFRVIDGSHRLAALNSLGAVTTKVLYPL